MTPEITIVATGLRFPEGPVWAGDGASLFVVELLNGTVVRVHLDGRVDVVARPGGSPNGAAIGPDGALYVANSGGWGSHDLGGIVIPAMEQPADYSGGRIERIDPDTGDVTVLYTECGGHPLKGPNDLVFDATGGIWFTDHGKQRARDRDHGGVYWCRPDGSEIREVIYPIDSPNGIGLSPDGSVLYVAETHTGRLYAWDVAAPGEVAPPPGPVGHGGRLLVGLPGMQLFDSLAVDGDGNVVVATLVNGGLTVVSPDGTAVEHVPLPDPMVTNVCFGGDDLRTAYVTLSGTGQLAAFEWPRPGLRLAF
jgi:gluconolactonase